MGNICKTPSEYNRLKDKRGGIENLSLEQIQKIDALSLKASIQEQQLKLARRRVDTLQWELNISNDIATDSEERIIAIITEKIIDELSKGILQPYVCTNESVGIQTFASILLQHFHNFDSFEQEIRNTPMNELHGDSSVERVAEVLGNKASGLRKDYIRTIVERYARTIADNQNQEVNIRLLWEDCEEAEKLGFNVKKLKALREKAINDLDVLHDAKEQKIENALNIADSSIERLMGTSLSSVTSNESHTHADAS